MSETTNQDPSAVSPPGGIRANIWKLQAFAAFNSAMVAIPIIVPLFNSYGLDMQDVFLLQAIFGLAVVLLEVPSGYFSDVLGRQRSLKVGSVLVVLGFGVYPFATSFNGFLIAELILGVGVSFLSGTGSAMLWDSLAELGETDRYPDLFGKQRFASSASEALASVAGGFLAVYSLQLPLVVQVVVIAGILPLAWSLAEPRRERFAATSGAVTGMLDIVREAAMFSPELRRLIVIFSVFSTATLSAAWFTQPWFEATGIPLIAFGVLWAVLRFSVGVAGLQASRLQRRFSSAQIIGGLLVILVIGFAGSALVQAVWMLPVLLSFAIVRGVSQIIFDDAINRRVGSDRRATVLSLQNLLQRLLFGVVGAPLGWLVDFWSLSVALWISGLGFGAFLFVLYVRWRMLDSEPAPSHS